MKAKILFTFLVVSLSFSAQVVWSQTKPTPILVDQFGPVPCDDFLARFDALMIANFNSPESIAYVYIYEQPDPLRSLELESRALGTITGRRFDASRIRIVRTAPSEGFQMQFWVVPAGATPPELTPSAWNLSLSLKKPLRYYSEDVSIENICWTGHLNEHFTELLLANPDVRGNIVVYASSAAKFRAERLERLNGLRSIPASRLRFIHIKRKQSGVEYWLVPPKKQK